MQAKWERAFSEERWMDGWMDWGEEIGVLDVGRGRGEDVCEVMGGVELRLRRVIVGRVVDWWRRRDKKRKVWWDLRDSRWGARETLEVNKSRLVHSLHTL